MRILFIGDIVAEPGRDAVAKVLPEIINEENVDFVIANVENLAHGRGATVETVNEMLDAGVNYFTGGDHLFWQRGFDNEIENLPVLRPANYPDRVPGKGLKLIDLEKKGKLLLINLMGRTFLNERLDDPFTKADLILSSNNLTDTYVLIDFHAEATSEKHAFAFYLDGRVDAVVGTHTHVPTCDSRVLPKGTMYVSDIGMTGNIDSVLGVKSNLIIDMYLTARNQKFEWEEKGKKAFRSVFIDTKSKDIRRVDRYI